MRQTHGGADAVALLAQMSIVAAVSAGAHPASEADSYVGDIPARLPTTVVRELSTIDPLRSTVAITTEWIGIVLAIVLYQRVLHPIFLPVVIMWIGARQHALAILMHEATHYLLFKNRRLNAIVSELFLAWPLFITTRTYRGSHFAHHRHVNTEKDPDLMRKQSSISEWEFPTSWRALVALLAKDVFGLHTHQLFSDFADMWDGNDTKEREGNSYAVARTLYYVVVLSLVTYFRLWPMFLLLWVVPIVTWLKMIMRIRSIAEHFAIENDHAYTLSRTTLPSLLERVFVAPRNVNFHLEHHLYPSVPFFRLPRLHTLLMKDAVFQSKAHITSTYWGVLRECVSGSR
jgi:fatty acid desaturase